MDKNYWNSYYQKHNSIAKPSSYAKSIINQLPEKCKFMELGCGNGRDSFYFASEGHSVFACDQSNIIINSLNEKNGDNPRFITADINQLNTKIENIFDVIYARFVLHALSKEEAQNALNWTFNHLESGGLFFSESRSIKDPIFGDGQQVESRIYKTDHQRRFLEKNEILNDLQNIGFVIDDVVEEQGLAVYKDSDPVVIRIVARKP
ncbi:MAG: class I SAM-dependent methyltransferase [Candidatus Marinimicrobia bacterium]|nr:class I SAM-dependent methyltransferase [Candidatus Neomarinimicrobiota bacterium]